MKYIRYVGLAQPCITCSRHGMQMQSQLKQHNSCSLAVLCLFHTAPLSLCPSLQEALPTCACPPCIEDLRVAALNAWTQRPSDAIESDDADFQGMLGCMHWGVPWPLAAAAAAAFLHGGSARGETPPTTTGAGTSSGGVAGGCGGYMSLVSEKVLCSFAVSFSIFHACIRALFSQSSACIHFS